MRFAANNLIRMSLTVTEEDGGDLVDPTAVTLRVRRPDGIVVDLSGAVVHDGTGQYHADDAFASGGMYTYEWTGTGAAVVQVSDSFTVVAAPF